LRYQEITRESLSPSDIEEEKLALGACWHGQAAQAAALLTLEDFSFNSHCAIFGAIQSSMEQGEAELELPMVAAELEEPGRLQCCGGIAYLFRARRLRELADRRHFARVADELSRKAINPAEEVTDTRTWLVHQLGGECAQ
jgi:replicative DNA helicase